MRLFLVVLPLLAGCLYDRQRFLELSQGFVDDDGDGYREIDGDCNDANPDIHPDVDELCDGIDNDCDGDSDSTALDIKVWYQDLDEDGYGNEQNSRYLCSKPNLFVDRSGDCDDSDATIHPTAAEDCADPIDRNCDGEAADDDGDGYSRCVDCFPEDPQSYPGSSESCDGIDNNCDGSIDNDATDATDYFYDADGDGYGTGEVIPLCTVAAGYALYSGDCDDTDRHINPGETEVCDNQVDDDCDGGAKGCRLSGAVSQEASANSSQAGFGSVFIVAPNADHDGLDDLLVGTPAEGAGGVFRWVDGGLTGAIPVDILTTMSVSADGLTGGFGSRLAVGDRDGDSLLDVAVRGSGVSSRGRIDLLELSRGSFGLSEVTVAMVEGVEDGGAIGYGALLLPGDTNRDGISELVVDTALVDAGAVYVFDTTLNGPVLLSDATRIFMGEESGDQAGVGVASIDYDGDGLGDWAIGAWRNSTGGANAGAIYLVPSGTSGVLSLADADIKILGRGDDYLGDPTLETGDWNGDGAEDLVVASDHHSTAPGAGAVAVLTAPFKAGLMTVEQEILGEDASDEAYVHRTGDLDGDGAADIVVGAPGHGAGGYVGVFYGGGTGARSLTSADAWVAGATGAEAGWSLDLGDLDGDHQLDVLMGEPGAMQIGVLFAYGL